MSTYFVGSATWDPGAITDLNHEAVDVTVTGAALGDKVFVTHSIDVADLQLLGTVTATNVVTAVLTNSGVGSPNMATGTVYCVVLSNSGQHV